MPFYLRKSIRVGFLRFNLSNSGIGVSAGVPGFRVGTGPRGTYIHAGRGGFYYRETLRGPDNREPSRHPTRFSDGDVHHIEPHTPVMREIESGDVARMVDTSSAKILRQINESRSKLSASSFVLIAASLGAYLIYPRVSPMWTAPLVVGLTVLARIRDLHRKTTVLMYEFEEPVESAVRNFHSAFEHLQQAHGLWHVAAASAVGSQDRKYQAGASQVVGRNAISLTFGELSFVRTNIPIPQIPVGKQTLHFLPDVLLIVEGDKVGAVSYGELRTTIGQTNFIETGGVPSDSKVVGSTWRYVNKSGGPDRRFKDNRQIPIARYEELFLRSRTGLNELIQISSVGAGAQFVNALQSLSAGAKLEAAEIPPDVGTPPDIPKNQNQTAETVRQAMLSLLELVDRVSTSLPPDEQQRNRSETQETLLGLIAAVIAADGKIDPEEQTFFRDLVDTSGNAGGDVATIREYAERWRVAPPTVPYFFKTALEYDFKNKTDVAQAMLAEIQLVGNNTSASDHHLAVVELKVVRQFLGFLNAERDAWLSKQ